MTRRPKGLSSSGSAGRPPAQRSTRSPSSLQKRFESLEMSCFNLKLKRVVKTKVFPFRDKFYPFTDVQMPKFYFSRSPADEGYLIIHSKGLCVKLRIPLLQHSINELLINVYFMDHGY